MAASDFHATLEHLYRISNGLENLAEAFFRTGNDMVSKELCQKCDDIREATEKLQKEYSDLLSRSLADSQRIVGGLLSATVNGCIKNRGASEKED